MKNLPRNMLASWCTVLLVSTVACTKAHFVLAANGAGGAGSGGDTGGAGSGGDTGGGGATGGAVDASLEPEAGMICSAPNFCESSTTPCDPFCQTGNCSWCSQKCTYAIAGATAQPTCAGKGPQTVSQPCGALSAGSATQNDNCAPGSICLQPINAAFCFRLCNSALDCPSGVDCGQRFLSPPSQIAVKVCDPYPYDQCGPNGTCCDPLAGPADTVCATNRFCFLVSSDSVTSHSRTVCEFSSGGGRNGSFCSSAHDCIRGNTCVDGACHRVCTGAIPCPTGTCTERGTEYGYCLGA